MTTIREQSGKPVMIAVEPAVKEQIKQLAGDKDIYVFVRDMVEDYAKNKQIPLNSGSRSNSSPAKKSDIDTLRDEVHKTVALMLAMPFMPMLNKPGEWQNTMTVLTSGMTDIEDMIVAKLASMPKGVREFLSRVLDKANKVEEARQGELTI